MPRKRILPAAFLTWLEEQPKGSIMKPATFDRIVDRQLKRLIDKGVPKDKALERAKASAGSAYWRAGTKKYVLSKLPPEKGAAHGKVNKRRRKKNPVLAVMGNPGKKSLFSRDVHSIAYTHTDDGENYVHEFAGGVCMQANRDGSITIFHPDKSIWRDFQ